MRIIVATHNEGKLVEINRILEDCLGADADQVELVSAGSLNLPDPVEDGVTFQENALLKARDVAARTGCPAVADDSGLIVDVMGNAPGILSARWAGKHGDDKANNALLLAQIADIPDAKRTARFRCAAALVVPQTEAGAAPMVVMRSLRKSWKPAKCRACCCMSSWRAWLRLRPAVRARRSAGACRRSRREAHVRADGTGRKERHLPSRQGVARPAAIRGHSAEVG